MGRVVPATLLLLVVVALCPLSPSAQEYYVTPSPPPNPACPADKPCHTLNYYTSDTSTIFGEGKNISLLFLDGYHETYRLFINHVQNLTLASTDGLFNNGTPRAEVKILSSFSLIIGALLKFENIALTDSYINALNMEKFVSRNVLYKNTFSAVTSTSTKAVYIEDSTFIDSGFIILLNGNLPSVTVEFINTVCYGAGFTITTNSDLTDVNVLNTTIEDSERGLIIEVERDLNAKVSNSKLSNVDEGITIRSVFTDHTNGILKANLTNTQFVGNQFSYSSSNFDSASISFQNTSVVQSVYMQASSFGTVVVIGPATVTMENCLFENNTGATVLLLTNVELYLQGNVLFSNNRGVSGGAMVMTNTTMWLDRDTQVKFTNNTASQVGGAIWLTQEPLVNMFTAEEGYPPCFYQLTFDIDEPINNQNLSALVTFQNNSAIIGGDDIYGTALQSDCKMTPNRQVESYRVFDQIIHFQKSSSLSLISSSPKRVCMCENGKPICIVDTNTYKYLQPYFYDVTVTPGEMFKLSLALVGNDFGLVTGGVYALDRSGKDTNFLFTPGYELQQITDLQCTEFEYYIHPRANQTTYEMILGTDSISAATQRILFQATQVFVSYHLAVRRYVLNNLISSIILNAPVFVKITILPCPLGMSLTTDTYSTCQCQQGLNNFAQDCLVRNNTGTLYRNETHWIGTSPNNNSTILANSLCPLGYCRTEIVGVELEDPDSQCALNHSGVLCGGCASGLTLAIGSSSCIQCDNNNGIALLLFFIIAGIVLVLGIKLLDITVAQGTINGLIFYANIIWIHQGTFFPVLNGEVNRHFSNFYYFLSLFIAWLNLDFGIETCFIQGMDAYGKTWLQFVFPVYLWLLAALIIACCSYSVKATKLFGNNAVTVLGTLFLLSYAKIQRTIVLIIAPAELTQFNPSGTRLAWRLDSNLEYFGNPHAFLFLMGLVAWFLLCVPFTGALLFVRPLQKLRCFTRIARQPLIDAYTGPLKAKHQYWVGLTLLTRGVLAITAGAFEGVNATVAIDLVLISHVPCSVL